MMTKRAKSPAEPKPPKKARKKPGRKKERVQISVRIDKTIMGLAYDEIEKSGGRITDLLERGLILAIGELREMPPMTHQARFILASQGVDFDRLVVQTGKVWVSPRVCELESSRRLLRETFLQIAQDVDAWCDPAKLTEALGRSETGEIEN